MWLIFKKLKKAPLFSVLKTLNRPIMGWGWKTLSLIVTQIREINPIFDPVFLDSVETLTFTLFISFKQAKKSLCLYLSKKYPCNFSQPIHKFTKIIDLMGNLRYLNENEDSKTFYYQCLLFIFRFCLLPSCLSLVHWSPCYDCTKCTAKVTMSRHCLFLLQLSNYDFSFRKKKFSLITKIRGNISWRKIELAVHIINEVHFSITGLYIWSCHSQS